MQLYVTSNHTMSTAFCLQTRCIEYLFEYIYPIRDHNVTYVEKKAGSRAFENRLMPR